MIVSTSSLRPLPTSQATVAWPASWVAMVRRSASVYSTGWARPISSVILACWRSFHEKRVGAAAQGPHQRLVHQVLDHHRRVAGGEGGQRLPPGRIVELGLVGLLAPGSSR